MKRFSPVAWLATFALVTTLAACGSSTPSNGSTSPTGTTAGSTTTSGTTTGSTTGSTTGTTTGSTTGSVITGGGNTAINGNTTGTATVSLTSSLGSLNFTAADAVYGVETLDGIELVVAVIADANGLCDAFAGSGLDSNVVVVQLVSASGGDPGNGNYPVQNANDTSDTLPTGAAGESDVGLLTAGTNSQEFDADGGNVGVTSYVSGQSLGLSVAATLSGSAAVQGTVNMPLCAALSAALAEGSDGTSAVAVNKMSKKVLGARKLFLKH